MTTLAASLALHNCAGAIADETRASFYSAPQRAACGGRFDPNKLTAAHRTLPCGSRVEVTSKATGRSVVVTITDRGPNARTGRDLDLSRAAAEVLGMRRAGVIVVTYRVLEAEPPSSRSPELAGTSAPPPSLEVVEWPHARRFGGCTIYDPCEDK
jgi:rare lipoprotein A